MPRAANPNAPTLADRQRAYQQRHKLRKVPLTPVSDADLTRLRRDGETDLVAIARVLREAVERMADRHTTEGVSSSAT